MPKWALKIKGKTLPKNPITVDVRQQVGNEPAAQSVGGATASEKSAEAFGRKGAAGGKSTSFKLPSSRSAG